MSELEPVLPAVYFEDWDELERSRWWRARCRERSVCYSSTGVLDVAARRAEKQASRDEDARALATGEKTREDLARENGAFAFPRDTVRLDLNLRTREEPVMSKRITNLEINAHDLITAEMMADIHAARNAAAALAQPHTMHDAACAHLRRQARSATIHTGASLQRAAVFFVYEALKTSDNPCIRGYDDLKDMLELLVDLADDLPEESA